MKRKPLQGLIGLAGAVILLLIAGGATVQLRSDRTFDDVPMPAIEASDDSAVIARGRYLTYGPAHCAYCHLPQDRWDDLAAGERPPLIGGFTLHTGFGSVPAPNLTPDPETGIGRYGDGRLARMLRHNIRPDGRAGAPFMEFQMMSDADLRAILSFLRSQPPVRNAVPERELNFLGKALFAFAFGPMPPPEEPPAEAPPPGRTLERGEYLANNVAQCFACHTERNVQTGEYIGPRFAGGFRMPINGNPDSVVVSPNITPAPETGVITGWTADRFVQRFKALGKVVPQSDMPWSAFAQMSDDDLRAIFDYLMSLEPVENETGPRVQPAE